MENAVAKTIYGITAIHGETRMTTMFESDENANECAIKALNAGASVIKTRMPLFP